MDLHRHSSPSMDLGNIPSAASGEDIVVRASKDLACALEAFGQCKPQDLSNSEMDGEMYSKIDDAIQGIFLATVLGVTTI